MRKLKHIVAEGTAKLKCCLANYFDAWDKRVEAEFAREDGEFSLALVENPEYVREMAHYMQDHAANFSDVRATLAPEVLKDLEREEMAFWERLLLEEEDVKNMYWHLSLKATVEVWWRSSWYFPEPATAHGLWDHMASIT